MLNLLEHIPLSLMSSDVLGYLSIKDIVMLERACGNKKSQHCFLELLLNRPPVVLPSSKHRDILALEWFSKRRCRIYSLTIQLSDDNPALYLESLILENIILEIKSDATIKNLTDIIESNICNLVTRIDINGDQNSEMIEQLSACTENVTQLTIKNSDDCIDWLTKDILSRWKLTEVFLLGCAITVQSVLLVVQTCSELTSIKLYSDNINDTAILAVAQHYIFPITVV